MDDFLKDAAANALGELLAAIIIAGTAYLFRKKIARLVRSTTLKSKGKSPSLTLDIDFVKSESNEWTTIFVIENTGNIDISGVRVFLCSHNSTTESLTIKQVKIDGQRKWINKGGHRLQLNTRSLHEGCNVTEDERYFVEFIDDYDGTIYRMSQGTPSAKDGKMAFYGTTVCRKRLPRRGVQATGRAKINRKVAKYDINLAVG